MCWKSPRSPAIFGSAVATIVWSSAASSVASIIPLNARRSWRGGRATPPAPPLVVASACSVTDGKLELHEARLRPSGPPRWGPARPTSVQPVQLTESVNLASGVPLRNFTVTWNGQLPSVQAVEANTVTPLSSAPAADFDGPGLGLKLFAHFFRAFLRALPFFLLAFLLQAARFAALRSAGFHLLNAFFQRTM